MLYCPSPAVNRQASKKKWKVTFRVSMSFGPSLDIVLFLRFVTNMRGLLLFRPLKLLAIIKPRPLPSVTSYNGPLYNRYLTPPSAAVHRWKRTFRLNFTCVLCVQGNCACLPHFFASTRQTARVDILHLSAVPWPRVRQPLSWSWIITSKSFPIQNVNVSPLRNRRRQNKNALWAQIFNVKECFGLSYKVDSKINWLSEGHCLLGCVAWQSGI